MRLFGIKLSRNDEQLTGITSSAIRLIELLVQRNKASSTALIFGGESKGCLASYEWEELGVGDGTTYEVLTRYQR